MTRARLISLLGSYGVVLALLLLILFGWARYDYFLGFFNITSVLRYNAMFALVALGMCFVIMTGGIDLSVGSTAALGSVVAALASPQGRIDRPWRRHRRRFLCRLDQRHSGDPPEDHAFRGDPGDDACSKRHGSCFSADNQSVSVSYEAASHRSDRTIFWAFPFPHGLRSSPMSSAGSSSTLREPAWAFLRSVAMRMRRV